MSDAADSRFHELVQGLLEKTISDAAEGEEVSSVMDTYRSNLSQLVSQDPALTAYRTKTDDSESALDFQRRDSAVYLTSFVSDPHVFEIPDKNRVFTIKSGSSASNLSKVVGLSQTFGHAEKEHTWVLAGIKGFVSFITIGKGSAVVFLSFQRNFVVAAGKGTGTWD
ncbi:hypothetical protein RhiJN_26650 [Ceratobasidium sp. AG-Ba]|nr:hypothetical protein RhiJN_12598 [Ceratobasidium sp. AG-Ba]QRV98631.1 hypothetical protein RhiJN_26650 [Ceratobasidium sp. AG-Ba]